MTKDQVTIGTTYRVKVSGTVQDVRITGVSPRGGWDATNVHTGRAVRIKSAQRLRGRVKVPGADEKPKAMSPQQLKAVHKADQENARLADERSKAPDGMTASERAMDRSAPKAKAAKPTTEAKPMSLIDAAAHLLSLGTGEPMRCKDIVDLAVQRGLWQPGSGKTPANTLYSAILREINTRGEASRFVKAERGKFALKR
jgi:hypothetical protein